MKFWLHIHNTRPEDMLELACLAEQVGFEGVLGDDHWFMPAGSEDHDPNERAVMPRDYVFPDVFAMGGAILARTTTLRFGTCILVIANRTNPFLIAKASSTLARLSGGRFVLGAGIGWMKDEYDIAGIDFARRAPRTEEMIAVLRKLWGPGPAEHHGEFFDFPATYAMPTPASPIPVYLGSIAPAALRRTGRIGDGWMGMTSALEDLPAQIALVNQGRAEAGRMDQPFEFMCGLKPHADGSLPSREDYERSAEMGITQHHFGPIEHMIGNPYPSFAEKKRVVEDFANCVMR